MEDSVRDAAGAARSKAISRTRGELVVALLRDETASMDPKFRHWAKKNGFKLLSYPPLGRGWLFIVCDDKEVLSPCVHSKYV